MRIRNQVISLRFTDFFLTKQNFQYFSSYFLLIFKLKLYADADAPFRNRKIFIRFFSIVQIWAVGSAQDPTNFDADPDSGSALEKMDPDPNPDPDPDPGYFLKIY